MKVLVNKKLGIVERKQKEKIEMRRDPMETIFIAFCIYKVARRLRHTRHESQSSIQNPSRAK